MEALLFMRFVTYLSIVGLGVNAYVKRSANDTTITSTSTTTRPFINRFDPMNMNYNAPIDMTWVELGYDPNFNGQQTVPATLDGLPGARQNNKLFFNQAEKALDLVPLSISNALFNKIRTSAVADEDFLLMSNLIMASLSDAFISSMSIAQQDRAVQSRMAGVMGLNHLIQRRLAQQPPSTRDNEELFGVDSVRCGVLLWKLRDSSLDQRLVPYDSLFELPLDQMKPLKQFLPGLTLTMARSFLTSISTDAEGKTALVIDSFPGTTADWLRHRGVCSSLFLAVYNNIAAQADQWNPPGYDNLKDKIVPMFSCVKPSYLLRFRFNELWPMIDELSSVDLDWQRGSAIVQQIFETSQSSDYNDQFFVRLNQLNRFLTIDLIQTHRFDDIFMNALLTKNSLVAISDQTNDPLLLEWLYSEVRSELYPNPLSGITSSVDMYTLGTMVAAMTVADIRSFQPRAVKENVGAFQSKGLTPGQMVTLVDIYMTEGNFDVLTLNSRDLENLRRLIPFLNYNRFITMEVSTINLQLVLLKDLAVRSRHKFPLTPAQKFAISGQLTVSTSKSLTEMVVTSLGPELSMELPPQVFLSELQSLSQLGFEVNDNGEVQLTSAMGEKVASQSWSDFQKTVIYKLYRKEAGPLTNVNEKALLQLKKLASGITTQDIFSSQFSSVIGITNAVMTNGGNMGKAWLLSLQIRRAFAAMYGLRSIDEFDLSLLGTANLMALDGLTLRMFSVKEMEGLNAADCQDVISKIGGLEDVYLIPHPKRRELVCFYIERCRFDYSPSQRNFVPSSSSSILQNYNPDDPRINRREYRYARKVFNYCDDLSPVSLTSGDFEILGHLACDIPASVIDAPNFPTDVLWMFHDCWFTEAQGKALFKKLTTGDNQELLYTDTTIAQLSHSLCSIVPPQHATVMRSKRYRKEIIDFVQYSYVLAKKMQETYGLTKRHLNKDIFWYRGISMQQQQNIADCYVRMSRVALDFFREYERNMFLRNVVVYDERLNLNPNSFQLRPVYHPPDPAAYEAEIMNSNYDTMGGDDFTYDVNDNNNNDNYMNTNNNDNTNNNNDAYDFGGGNEYGADTEYGGESEETVSRQRREYFDYLQQRITCPEVHVLNTGNRVWSLMDLEWMQPEELSRCIFYFGNNPNMTFQQRTILKDKIAMLVGGFGNIPAEYLIQMGSIALTMREWELRALKIADPQVMYFVGEWNWAKWQRVTLYLMIRKSYKLFPAGMETWDIKSLGEFVCGMRPVDLARFYTETYYLLAFFFAELSTCNYKQLKMILPKAKSTASFGPVSGWTDAEILAIGSPLAALSVSEFDSLTPSKSSHGNRVAAIAPHVIPIIPPSTLKKLRVEFFQSMTIEQVIAMKPVQWGALNDGQAFAAMDIWFGFDNWPMSFLRDLQAASSLNIQPLKSLVLSLSLFTSLYRFL